MIMILIGMMVMYLLLCIVTTISFAFFNSDCEWVIAFVTFPTLAIMKLYVKIESWYRKKKEVAGNE